MAESRSSLSRALSILESFSEDRPEQTLRAIVSATGLPPATAHRYLAELVKWGGLDRTGRGTYTVGRRLWQLGALAPRERQLRDVALPVLEDLFETTHEVVHLVVLDDLRALYIEKLEPRARAGASVSSQVGYRLPLHATGPGKVLLAFGDSKTREEILAGELPRMASQTITDPHTLQRALAEIRSTGFAISRNEMTEGNASAAAPVFDKSGRVVAAISVVVPAANPNLSALAQGVRVAAAVITRTLRA
ncbi:putative transcriptional regulator, IclR family [Gordonia polyisoprenivorans VH2]|uniref:IclR family transcriptional regulator n=2 Tax=Gordonia polyisoprenivorans TaxID=84595 RepID=A0A846WPJ3_9ACTN|nr:IclR family transcriptional regulator [Gordonia polyisoprenivorans]AFA75729.1 putative transcriptional regulator, IclR family [Gordonia polyisoprenivorans VH2]NKY02896.1 IclR family transcriptional regulator [Gordonia polyisoprenivorans]WCB37238.1 IclR family transcriptional regulator [Gordonia polyisoprenivorans]GAB24981.1 putative IclR family transcriptional regulator [Gordonia polyisoprenivorans NBRC 16320 = JCM 10675]